MSFEISIPTPNGQHPIKIKLGSSVIFVGANGGGKTRLAVHIEMNFESNTHRISGHRALVLNPTVPKIAEEDALSKLRAGADKKSAYPNANTLHTFQFRSAHRWRKEPAVGLLNDFDSLVQALFADQTNKALETHKRVQKGNFGEAAPTRFEQLSMIWEHLLPDRQLDISGDDIGVGVQGSNGSYKASDLSDGERAVFYLIGQTLTAADSSLLIIDEPELHVHRSIVSKLWDKLEAARKDCAFVFITHDLEFAATRIAQKFVVHGYHPAPQWNIEEIPDDTGFSEELTTLVLGSRRPVLFVEGEKQSLDTTIYRCCFPNWTVIPRGSCEAVIHSVVTMRNNEALHRVRCSGIIDADNRQSAERTHLNELGIVVLPVSEIENIILLPAVSRTIAEIEGYKGPELEKRLSELQSAIFATLDAAMIDAVAVRYCKRRIGRALKKIDLGQVDDIESLSEVYRQQTGKLNIDEYACAVKTSIRNAVEEKDLCALLLNYDNKNLISLAAHHLKNTKKKEFESWLTRILANNNDQRLIEVLLDSIPTINNAHNVD